MSFFFVISGEEKGKKEVNSSGELKRGKTLKETGPRHVKRKESLFTGKF